MIEAKILRPIFLKNLRKYEILRDLEKGKWEELAWEKFKWEIKQ